MNSAIDSAYRRFSTKRFPLPTESQVEALEKRIDVGFLPDYRDFVLRFNGGYFDAPIIESPTGEFPQDALRRLYGIGATHPYAELGNPNHLSLLEQNTPPQLVPIGSTAMGGLIVLVTRGEDCGEVLYKKAFGEFYYLADGIEEFFGRLKEPATEKD